MGLAGLMALGEADAPSDAAWVAATASVAAVSISSGTAVPLFTCDIIAAS